MSDPADPPPTGQTAAEGRSVQPLPAARIAGGWLVVVAVIVLALNLRPAVNAVGAVLPEIRTALGLSATAAGALTSLPPLCFAVFGLLAPALAGRLGTERVLVLALVVMALGQLARVMGAEVALFVGSFATLAGLALCNVLVPSVIRAHFPARIPLMTALYTTCLVIGAAVSSSVAVPVANSLGADWRVGLGMWTVLTAVALVPWLALIGTRPAPGAAVRRSTMKVRELRHSRVAWNLTIYFALQSAQAYVVTAWLAQIMVDDGADLRLGGYAVGVFAAMGIVAALGVPILLRHEQHLRAIITMFTGFYLVGYLGLMLYPAAAVWCWAVLLGLGSGSFPLILALIALRARSPAGVAALSAFTQCIGYLLGAAGPVVIGAVHDLTGGWTVPLLVMIGSLVVMVVFGRRAADPTLVEDDLARRA